MFVNPRKIWTVTSVVQSLTDSLWGTISLITTLFCSAWKSILNPFGTATNRFSLSNAVPVSTDCSVGGSAAAGVIVGGVSVAVPGIGKSEQARRIILVIPIVSKIIVEGFIALAPLQAKNRGYMLVWEMQLGLVQWIHPLTICRVMLDCTWGVGTEWDNAINK